MEKQTQQNPENPSIMVNTFELLPGQSIFLYADGLTENSGSSQKPIRPRVIQKILEDSSNIESRRNQ